MKQPVPPSHLSSSSKTLWKSILRDWEIGDAAYLAVLQAGLEARDRANKCRLAIAKDGELVEDRFGQRKAHPLLQAERDNRAAFLNAIKTLGLEEGTK